MSLFQLWDKAGSIPILSLVYTDNFFLSMMGRSASDLRRKVANATELARTTDLSFGHQLTHGGLEKGSDVENSWKACQGSAAASAEAIGY